VSQLNIFDAISGDPMGIINWFAVHPTSMNNTNKLISGDNKGYASQLFEKHINGKEVRPGKVKSLINIYSLYLFCTWTLMAPCLNHRNMLVNWIRISELVGYFKNNTE